MTKEELIKNPRGLPVRTGDELRRGPKDQYLKPGDRIVFTYTAYATHLMGIPITIASKEEACILGDRSPRVWNEYPEGTFVAPEAPQYSNRKMIWMIENGWKFYVIPKTRKIGVFKD